MKFVRFILIMLITGLSWGVASAQTTTTVSGTITDSDTFNWIGAKIQFSLFNPFGTQNQITFNGNHLTAAQLNVIVTTDNTGTFSVALIQNSVLQPANTTWMIQVCPQASVACQNIPKQTIFGATQSLSTVINANIIAPRFPAAYSAVGYGDVEVQQSGLGSTYFNVTTTNLRLWNGTGWINTTSPTVPQQNFLFMGDSITCGLHSSTSCQTYGSIIPGVGYAARTTASAPTNSSTMTVANAAGIVVGQYIIAVPQPTGVFAIAIAAGTLVTSVAGTTIGLSINTQTAFSNTQVTFINADYPSVAMSLPGFTGKGTGLDYGSPGAALQDMINSYFVSVHSQSPVVTGVPSTLFLMGGINDITAGTDAATIVGKLTLLYQDIESDGWTLVVETILPGPFTTTQAQTWQAVNQWIRAQSGMWNRLIDTAAILPNNYDTNLFFITDHEHLINSGYAILANAVNESQASQVSVLGSPQNSPPLWNNGPIFTASGCTNSTLIGGSTAGSYHSGTTGTCTVVITPGVPASNGWVCKANDLTTPADIQTQTATTTTTATISGTTVTADVINFSCTAY
jgi:lysophospholipase L1-like esterase